MTSTAFMMYQYFQHGENYYLLILFEVRKRFIIRIRDPVIKTQKIANIVTLACWAVWFMSQLRSPVHWLIRKMFCGKSKSCIVYLFICLFILDFFPPTQYWSGDKKLFGSEIMSQFLPAVDSDNVTLKDYQKSRPYRSRWRFVWQQTWAAVSRNAQLLCLTKPNMHRLWLTTTVTHVVK